MACSSSVVNPVFPVLWRSWGGGAAGWGGGAAGWEEGGRVGREEEGRRTKSANQQTLD